MTPTPALAAAAPAPTESQKATRTQKVMFGALCVFLGAVVLAPILLSAQDLYEWARSLRGLNQPHERALLIPVALDIAAAACIVMTIISSIWKRERAGFFAVMVWIFAGVSAYAQYSHGIAERDAGRAQDAWWLFPTIALLGPLLLEEVLRRFRKWARKDVGEELDGAAGFGNRWIPGVAFRETAKAWAASRREGISTAKGAIAFVRAQKAIKHLSDADALRYGVGELRTEDMHTVRVWLQSLGREVGQNAIDQANGIEAALAAKRHEVTRLEQQAAELEAQMMARKAQVDEQIVQAQQELERIQLEAEVQPSLAETAAEQNKTAAIHVAHTALATVSAAQVRAFLEGRGVVVSEQLIHKARGQARQAAGLEALQESTGEHKVIELRQRGSIGAQ